MTDLLCHAFDAPAQIGEPMFCRHCHAADSPGRQGEECPRRLRDALDAADHEITVQAGDVRHA